MNDYSDETLMAFADGALDEPTFSEIAAAIEADAELAARVEALARGRDLAREGFGPPEPVPFLLRRKVEMVIGRAERRQPRFIELAAAASVAVLVALPLGWFAGQQSTLTPASPIAGTELGDEVAALLSTLPSGSEQRLAAGPLLRTIATFETAEGTLCREVELDSSDTAAVLVSCHDGGAWRTAFSTSSLPAGDGYAPASSLEALDAYLAAVGASEPMTAEAEAEALAR